MGLRETSQVTEPEADPIFVYVAGAGLGSIWVGGRVEVLVFFGAKKQVYVKIISLAGPALSRYTQNMSGAALASSHKSSTSRRCGYYMVLSGFIIQIDSM